jgi:hypothetical protein
MLFFSDFCLILIILFSNYVSLIIIPFKLLLVILLYTIIGYFRLFWPKTILGYYMLFYFRLF